MFFIPLKLALLSTLLGSCTANLLTPFPTTASDGAIKFQPVLDFDKDSCYHTAAVSTNLATNQGLDPHDMGFCRDGVRLERSQTYVRQRCNHGWCAYLYGYYFEQDGGLFEVGHRHDWEHVIVWTLNDNVFFVSWSGHGGYTTAHQTAMRFQGTHPKMVYHRGGVKHHSLRKATREDDDHVENATGGWFKAPLVSVEKMSCDFNRKLMNSDWGSAHPDFSRDRFGPSLDGAMPWDARNNEHFDPWH